MHTVYLRVILRQDHRFGRRHDKWLFFLLIYLFITILAVDHAAIWAEGNSFLFFAEPARPVAHEDGNEANKRQRVSACIQGFFIMFKDSGLDVLQNSNFCP